MSVSAILENWSEYDERKKGEGEDPAFFCVKEEWEVDFLISKIFWRYPFFTEDLIRNTVLSCCKDIADRVCRKELVAKIADRLGVSQS